jgi:hypothetical protein
LKGPAVKPIIPLEVEKPEDPDDDKSKFVSMEVKNRVDEKTSFKMHLKVFEEGSPQQWLDLLHDVKIVWTQNGLNKAKDRVACLLAVLRGESKTAFEAALVELAVDEDNNIIELTNEMVELALKEVGKGVFPLRALELQRLWMLRYMRKPKSLSVRKTANAITKMNNALPLFPDGDEDSKFSESELVGLIEWSLPPLWRTKFDLDNYIPTLYPKARLISECEAIERNLGAFDDDKDKKNKKQKKGKNAKSGGGEQKRDRGDTDKPFWCKLCKKIARTTPISAASLTRSGLPLSIKKKRRRGRSRNGPSKKRLMRSRARPQKRAHLRFLLRVSSASRAA